MFFSHLFLYSSSQISTTDF